MANWQKIVGEDTSLSEWDDDSDFDYDLWHITDKAPKAYDVRKIAEEIKEYCQNTDKGLVCNDCKKTFTDPLFFKYHLKEKKENELSQYLKNHPEIECVLAYDNPEASDDEIIPYLLRCTLCKLCLSNIKTAQKHIKTQNHLSKLPPTISEGANSLVEPASFHHQSNGSSNV